MECRRWTYGTCCIILGAFSFLFNVKGQNETHEATLTPAYLYSPGYIRYHDYAPNIIYDYLVETKCQNHTLMLTMKDCGMQWTKHGECFGDTLRIFDGFNDTACLIDTFCCNDTSLPVWYTSGPYVYLVFTTDASYNFKGFKMEFESFDPTTTTSTTTTCRISTTTTTATIKKPPTTTSATSTTTRTTPTTTSATSTTTRTTPTTTSATSTTTRTTPTTTSATSTTTRTTPTTTSATSTTTRTTPTTTSTTSTTRTTTTSMPTMHTTILSTLTTSTTAITKEPFTTVTFRSTQAPQLGGVSDDSNSNIWIIVGAVLVSGGVVLFVINVVIIVTRRVIWSRNGTTSSRF